MSEQNSAPLASFLRQHFVTAASLAAAAFVGYCIYFDHKRRMAPDYKQRIRENRRAAAKSKGSSGATSGRPMPNLRNPTEVQAFFLQEVQLGEELMSTGNLEEGTEHICNAITICGQPQQLLQIFQQTLPPEHFALIVQKLPEAKNRIAGLFKDTTGVTEEGRVSLLAEEKPSFSEEEVALARSGLEDLDDLE